MSAQVYFSGVFWRSIMGFLLLAQPAMGQAQFSYLAEEGGNLITGYTGSGGDLTIPRTIGSGLVIGIVARVFQGNTRLVSVTFPNSLTTIGDAAFSGCTGLTDITMSQSLTTIGANAFSGCTTLTSSITTPQSLTIVGANAFSGCISLTNINISDSVGTTIGANSFSGCTSLRNVTLGNGVVGIPDGMFSGCTNLTSVKLGFNIDSIGDEAFRDCGRLTSLILRGAVFTIGNRAFSGCTGLARVYVEGIVPKLGSDVFSPTPTVYYVPGTQGWGTTFGGCPTALWLPQVQTSEVSLGGLAKPFGFTINWVSDRYVDVQASSDLAKSTWNRLSTTYTYLTNGTAYVTDPNWRKYPVRFYRVRTP